MANATLLFQKIEMSMHTILTPQVSTPPGADASKTMKRTRKVVDSPTRAFHWLFAFCFLGAYLTAESESFRKVHVTLGYTMAGLLIFRIVWGIVGPKHVRLSLMFRKLSGIFDWLKSFKVMRPFSLKSFGGMTSINWKQGQNFFMAFAVIALLVMIIPVTLTGYASYNDWGGEWLQQIHESLGEFYLFIVLSHLSLIALLSVLRLKNIAGPMITGSIAGPGPDLIRRDYRWMTYLMLGSVLFWWVWQCF